VQTGSNPLDPASFNLTAALESLQVTPSSFRIISNTVLGGGSRQLRVTGRLIDGRTLDVTSRRYGTSYTPSNLLIANFGPEDGRIYAGNDGTTSVIVSVGGRNSTAAVTVQTFSPQGISSLLIPGFANSVVVEGNYAYVAAGAGGLQVVDVSNLNHPFIAGFTFGFAANDVRLAGPLALVASGRNGLVVVDVSNPALPRRLGSAITPGVATDLAVSGSFVYVADEIGLRIFDISRPAFPRLIGGLDLPGGRASGVDVSGTLAVVADSEGGVVVVDVSTPSAPRITGRTATRPDGTSGAADLVVRDRLAYVADGAHSQLGGLRIVDFSDPATPAVVGTSNDAFGLTSVAVEKGVALASDFYFVNAVPVFQLNTGDPSFSGVVDFWAPPVKRQANGSGLDVHNGVVFMVGANTYGAGYIDNGVSGESYLHIGQYAIYSIDDAEISPTVSLTSSAQSTSIAERSLLVLTADAKDDVQVDSVDLLANGHRIATLSRPPFQLKYTVPEGVTLLTITALARDTAGSTATSDPLTFMVTPNPSPVVRLLAPTGGLASEGSQIALVASATSQQGILRVDFFVNGAGVASVSAPPYQALYRIPSGATQLAVTAIAYDAFGASVPDGATVKVVLHLPPVAVFLTPRDGDSVVEGSAVQILGGITDDLGIVRANLFAEGALGVSLTRPPWTWSTSAPARGQTKQLRLQVFDSGGRSTQTSITIIGAADPLTSIHGTVIDPIGRAVAGAQVVENNGGGGATTGADGQFLILGVPTTAGSLSVTVSASLAGAPYNAQSSTFTPVPGGQVELGQLVLASASSTVTGVVLDPSNRPISGAGIVIVAPGPLFFRGTTDAAGRFRVAGVPQNASNSFAASATQGFFTLRASFLLSVSAADGDPADLGSIVLAPTELPTTVQGTVVDAANQPLSGALVKVYNDEIFASTTSAADGSFMIPGLPAADGANFFVSARITLGGDPFFGSTSAGAIPGGVTDAGAIVPEILTLDGTQPTRVQGQLATLSGQPVGNARIVVITFYDAYPGTATGGQYAISGIPSDEGPILIAATTVLDGGYLTARAQSAVTPNAGGTTLIDDLSFDDTYHIEQGGGRLRTFARLLPYDARAESICRIGNSAGGR
jgi:hypothetical protein